MVSNFLNEYSLQILLYNIQSPFDLKSYKISLEIKKNEIIIMLTPPSCAFYKFDFY